MTAFKTSDYLGMLRELAPELVGARAAASCMPRACPRCAPSSSWATNALPGMLHLRRPAWPAAAATTRRSAALGGAAQPDDPINIQFTSGTTGFPKGATLTHRNILNNGFFIGEAMRLTEHDRLCIPVPLYHCFGMVLGNLACVTHGAAMVYPNDGFDPLRGAADGAGGALHRRCTACRPCSSPNWTIRASRSSTFRPCAPASWRARPARSK